MDPVSSEIMIATASLCSVIPTAALCLKPNCSGSSELSVKGKIHDAALIWPSAMTTAPSCRGEVLEKMDSSKRFEIFALMLSPLF